MAKLTRTKQSVLNHSPSPKLKKSNNDLGVALKTAFSQLPVATIILTLFISSGDSEEIQSIALVWARQLTQFTLIADAPDTMYTTISTNADKRRQASLIIRINKQAFD